VQMPQDATEHSVLEHVGKVAGVKGVPVVHCSVASGRSAAQPEAEALECKI
jgi:hypothetical protein